MIERETHANRYYYGSSRFWSFYVILINITVSNIASALEKSGEPTTSRPFTFFQNFRSIVFHVLSDHHAGFSLLIRFLIGHTCLQTSSLIDKIYIQLKFTIRNLNANPTQERRKDLNKLHANSIHSYTHTITDFTPDTYTYQRPFAVQQFV